MNPNHEASRRAEQDMGRSAGTPSDGEGLPTVHADKRPRRASNLTAVLTGAAMFAIVALIWHAAQRSTEVSVPQQAEALPADATAATEPADAPIATVSQESPPTEADLVIRKTLDSLTYYTPRPASGDPLSQPAAAPADPPLTSPGKPDTAGPATDPSPQVARGVKPAAGRFKLDGVMQGAADLSAIINGQVVRVGDTIDGAKVVSILPQSVELEVDGQRLHIRM